jgi:septum formation protein
MKMSSTPLLILASNSPRRQELLKLSGFEFEVFVRDFPEDFPDDMDVYQVAEFLAEQKNKHYRLLRPEALILTADTTVIANQQVINKPKDFNDAVEMLGILSGNTHQVVSGVCISSPDKKISFSETTEVTFAELSKGDIENYINQYKPFDKAGSYGIQESIGLTHIESIKGSFYNVMGLPTHKVYKILANEFGVKTTNPPTGIQS